MASRLGQVNVNIANALNLLLGGTSSVYYGEEIGMQDLPVNLLVSPENNIKNAFRSPMQWATNVKNSGFTENKTTWLPLNPDSTTRNVQVRHHFLLNTLNPHYMNPASHSRNKMRTRVQ